MGIGVDVLGDQPADLIGFAVGGGQGTGGIGIRIQIGLVIGHVLLDDVIEGDQDFLVHAVHFKVEAAADNDVRILAAGEHQVDLGAPVRTFDLVEVGVNAGEGGDAGLGIVEVVHISEGQIVDIAVPDHDVDFLGSIRDGSGEAGKDHHQGENESNCLFHEEGLLLYIFGMRTRGETMRMRDQPLMEPIMTPLTKNFCMHR